MTFKKPTNYLFVWIFFIYNGATFKSLPLRQTGVMKKISFVLLLSSFCLFAAAQDTIRVMTYNLLYYNLYNSYCTNSNNNVDTKDAYLKTIIAYTLPDIIAFNEVKGDNATNYRLKGSVLNSDGRNYYISTAYPYGSGSLTSFLFFNKNKFYEDYELYNINTDAARDFNIYKLRVKNTNPAVYVYVIPAHLKAGSYDDDIAERAQMIDSVMSKIDEMGGNDNFIFLGDLNIYSSTETGFQKLINSSNFEYRFYDPINQLGAWNNNYSFRNYHTQSTSSQGDDCKASGGMDDRFDIMLVDDDIISGASGVKYIEDSYATLGQDGLHFNESINNGNNNSVPSNVLNALVGMSDHLPVYADFVVGASNDIPMPSANKHLVTYNNPVKEFLYVQLMATSAQQTSIRIFDITGNLIFTERLFLCNSAAIQVNLSAFPSGLYLLHVESPEAVQTFKIVKH